MRKYLKDPLSKTQTAYAILNCSPDDNVAAIRKQYIELKMKFPEKTTIYHDAFRVLKTPIERLKLDFYYYVKWRK